MQPISRATFRDQFFIPISLAFVDLLPAGSTDQTGLDFDLRKKVIFKAAEDMDPIGTALLPVNHMMGIR
jgi:hypothetical protein